MIRSYACAKGLQGFTKTHVYRLRYMSISTFRMLSSSVWGSDRTQFLPQNKVKQRPRSRCFTWISTSSFCIHILDMQDQFLVKGNRHLRITFFNFAHSNWKTLAPHIFGIPTMKNCNNWVEKYGGPRLSRDLRLLQKCIETTLSKMLHFLARFEYGGPSVHAGKTCSLTLR